MQIMDLQLDFKSALVTFVRLEIGHLVRQELAPLEGSSSSDVVFSLTSTYCLLSRCCDFGKCQSRIGKQSTLSYIASEAVPRQMVELTTIEYFPQCTAQSTHITETIQQRQVFSRPSNHSHQSTSKRAPNITTISICLPINYKNNLALPLSLHTKNHQRTTHKHSKCQLTRLSISSTSPSTSVSIDPKELPRLTML